MSHFPRTLLVLALLALFAFPAVAADTPADAPNDAPAVEQAVAESPTTEVGESLETQELEFLAKTVKIITCVQHSACETDYDCRDRLWDGSIATGACRLQGNVRYCECP